MIKQTIKDEIVYLSIANHDFSYRIPLPKIGKTMDWKIGAKGEEGIVIEDVSAWTISLFTKPNADAKFLKQFIAIIEEHAPNSSINWDNTRLALNIQNQYNWLIETNKTAKKVMSPDEIMLSLKKKFNRD